MDTKINSIGYNLLAERLAYTHCLCMHGFAHMATVFPRSTDQQVSGPIRLALPVLVSLDTPTFPGTDMSPVQAVFTQHLIITQQWLLSLFYTRNWGSESWLTWPGSQCVCVWGGEEQSQCSHNPHYADIAGHPCSLQPDTGWPARLVPGKSNQVHLCSSTESGIRKKRL